MALLKKNPCALKYILESLRVIKIQSRLTKCELKLRENKLKKMEFAALLQGQVSISIYLNAHAY